MIQIDLLTDRQRGNISVALNSVRLCKRQKMRAVMERRDTDNCSHVILLGRVPFSPCGDLDLHTPPPKWNGILPSNHSSCIIMSHQHYRVAPIECIHVVLKEILLSKHKRIKLLFKRSRSPGLMGYRSLI